MLRRLFLIVATLLMVASCGVAPASTGSDGGMIDGNAAQAEADAALADVPAPPGSDIAVKITDRSATYQTGYGRSAVEGLAICAWFRYWLDGVATSDQTKIAAAKGASKLFPTWDIYVSADQSFRDVINGVVDKAILADAGPMADFVRINCAT